jgi:hypothetical protein
MRNLFGRISRFLFGRLPPLMNWEILIGKTVVGKITSESVYWNGGYGYYHFSPAAGFTEIIGFAFSNRHGKQSKMLIGQIQKGQDD